MTVKEQLTLIRSKTLQYLNLRYLKFLRPSTQAKRVESTTSIQSYSKTVLHLQVVCHLFSTNLQHNSIPQEWGTHCVIPIYKTGDKSSVSNYRPISLLCNLSLKY